MPPSSFSLLSFQSKWSSSIVLCFFLIYFLAKKHFYHLKITLNSKVLKSLKGLTLKFNFSVNQKTKILLSCLRVKTLCAGSCATERRSCLSPPRGTSLSSPATVVGIAGYRGRVLGQARSLGWLSHRVEARLPHRGTLPHAGAPLLLSALHAAPSAPVQAVHLRRATVENLPGARLGRHWECVHVSHSP